MSPSERRAATVKLLAELDQDEQEAAEVASDLSTTLNERRRAIAYRRFFRGQIARAENLLSRLEAEA